MNEDLLGTIWVCNLPHMISDDDGTFIEPGTKVKIVSVGSVQLTTNGPEYFTVEFALPPFHRFTQTIPQFTSLYRRMEETK